MTSGQARTSVAPNSHLLQKQHGDLSNKSDADDALHPRATALHGCRA